MSTTTFLWHDYETFGANTRRDRPAQFAAIRTDAELNEIGDPIMLYCKPANDFLPDPAILPDYRHHPQQCLEWGVPEHRSPPPSSRRFRSPAPSAWATTPSASTTKSPVSCSGVT
jgi:exodeoxyribonuclease-1